MDKPIAAFVLLICFSFFYSEYPYASRLQAYLIIGYAGLFYYLINRQNGRNDIIRLVWFLVIFGSLFATSGLIFAGVNLPGDSSVSFSFVNSNHFAGYLEMIALLAMGLAFAYGGGKRFLLLALCVFISIAIFFSLSRGGVLGFLSGTAFFAFYYVRRKKISTLTLIAFAFSLFCFTVWLGNEAFFERMATLKEPLIAGKERLIIWRGASGIIGDNFWLGTGIGTFRYSFPRYLLKPVQTAISHAHNDYLEVIAETGIAGGLILLSGVIILFLKAMKCFSGDERSRLQPVGIGALSGCFALLVHGMTDFNFHIPSNAILFVVFSSVIVNSSALIQRPHSEKRMRMIDINIQAKFILPLYTAAAICAFISFAAVISPYIGEIHMKEARKHQLSEDYDSAYAHLNKALFWDPGNAGNMAAMGDLLITRSFLARSNSEKEWYIIRSLKYFEDATAACPVNSYFYSKKGFVLDRMGRANEAETALAKSVELAPANSFARYTLASFYIQHKDMDKAYDSYAHLLRLDLSFFPKVFESIWKVRPDYEQMKRAIPEIPAIRVEFSEHLFNAREPDAALDELRFAFSLEPSPGYALSHLQGLCRVKRWDLALKAGEEYISRFRDDKPLLKQMAIIYENSGNDKAAAGIYEKLMSANPEEASLYVAAADFYRRKERYAEAVDLLKIGISRLPDEKNLYFALDGLYQLRRQNKEAAESLKSLLAYMPDDAEIYYIIALNYREARMQEEALAYMKKAVFHRPASEDYRYTLGIWYMELGLYAQSVEQIKKCLEINSKNKSCERAFDKIYKEVGITK